MTDEENETASIRQHINACRGWNDGAGLIVPETVAEDLQRRGITEGYTSSTGKLPYLGEQDDH